MIENKGVVRRISAELDKDVRTLQAEIMKSKNKTVPYKEASRIYALTSFNGKMDIMHALRKMDKL